MDSLSLEQLIQIIIINTDVLHEINITLRAIKVFLFIFLISYLVLTLVRSFEQLPKKTDKKL